MRVLRGWTHFPKGLDPDLKINARMDESEFSAFHARDYYDADKMSSPDSEASSPRRPKPPTRRMLELTRPPSPLKKRKREHAASLDDTGEKNVECAEEFTAAVTSSAGAAEARILPLFGGKGKRAAHVKLLRPSTLAGLSAMYKKHITALRCTPLDAKRALDDLVTMLNIVDAFLHAHAKLADTKYHVCKSAAEQHIRLLAKHYNTK